jgi:hypothetical protein
VVDKVALGKVFPRVLRLSLVNFIPLLFRNTEKRKYKHLAITFITGLHKTSQGCGASVAFAAGPLKKEWFASCSGRILTRKILRYSSSRVLAWP